MVALSFTERNATFDIIKSDLCFHNLF